ncbi:hypothetical protein CB1_000880044 [Camelus ferus]|nr:hypothetical protein CB1_000880044 [Camelus ferus]
MAPIHDVIQLLKAGKAKEVSYNALASHIISEDGDNPEVGEAREVFDLPVVKVSMLFRVGRCRLRVGRCRLREGRCRTSKALLAPRDLSVKPCQGQLLSPGPSLPAKASGPGFQVHKLREPCALWAMSLLSSEGHSDRLFHCPLVAVCAAIQLDRG